MAAGEDERWPRHECRMYCGAVKVRRLATQVRHSWLGHRFLQDHDDFGSIADSSGSAASAVRRAYGALMLLPVLLSGVKDSVSHRHTCMAGVAAWLGALAFLVSCISVSCVQACHAYQYLRMRQTWFRQPLAERYSRMRHMWFRQAPADRYLRMRHMWFLQPPADRYLRMRQT